MGTGFRIPSRFLAFSLSPFLTVPVTPLPLGPQRGGESQVENSLSLGSQAGYKTRIFLGTGRCWGQRGTHVGHTQHGWVSETSCQGKGARRQRTALCKPIYTSFSKLRGDGSHPGLCDSIRKGPPFSRVAAAASHVPTVPTAASEGCTCLCCGVLTSTLFPSVVEPECSRGSF